MQLSHDDQTNVKRLYGERDGHGAGFSMGLSGPGYIIFSLQRRVNCLPCCAGVGFLLIMRSGA